MSRWAMRNAARCIAVLWAGFWTWFCIASAIGERQGLAGALMHQVPAAVMVASVLLAWRWPRVGGALLVAEALFVASPVWVHFSPGRFLVLGLPPLVAGIFFLISGSPSRTQPAGP